MFQVWFVFLKTANSIVTLGVTPWTVHYLFDCQFRFFIYFQHMVGEKGAEEAVNKLDDSEFSGTHIQVQVRH